MTDWLSRVRDSMRAQLWPLPTAGVVLAVVLGIVLPRIDDHLDGRLPDAVNNLLFGGDPGAARTPLDAIASSLITVTALTFSLTVVTLQLASSQFSPRLLRTFTRDLFVQATLALFLGTFAYSLTALRSVRSSGDGQIAFVPQLSVTVAFVLAVASVIGLVLFLAHLTRQIRVETMLRNVHVDATETLETVLGTAHPPRIKCVDLPRPPEDAVTLFAQSSGFLVSVNESELLAAAVAANARVLLERPPGSWVVAKTPIGSVWSATAARLDGNAVEELLDRLGRAIHTGIERTAAQDIGYGLRQLTDVANKALSPGINDPTTAVHALGHTSALLCELAEYELGPVTLHDDTSPAQVALARQSHSELLDVAMTQPRRYGASDPMVLARLYRLLSELAWCARVSDQKSITDQLSRLRRTSRSQDFDETELSGLEEAATRVERSLARRLAAPRDI